jgi:hypothetical protein
MRFIFLVGLIVSGCASVQPNQARLTIDSNPPGATLSDSSGTWGVAPQTRVWTLTGPTAVTNPIYATWVSGATASVRLNIKGGQEGSWSFQRPQNAPGLDQDLRWAMHLSQEQAREKAATNQMYKELGDSFARARRERDAEFERNRPINTMCIGMGRDMVSCTSN